MPSATFSLYRDAIQRRFRRLLGQENNPYPPRPLSSCLSPSLGHRQAVASTTPVYAFPADASVANITEWQVGARARLAELIGYSRSDDLPQETARNARIEIEDGITRETIYLRTRANVDVPVTLVEPVSGPNPRPVFIHLAGSTSGVHLGWGEAKIPIDHMRLEAGAAMALEAARRGYMAVCIEQIGFGERAEHDLDPRSGNAIVDAAHHAMLLGRTLAGENAEDISATINWLCANSERLSIDRARIFAFGHSTGGTTLLYAAAVEERIAGVLCSGSIGRLRDGVAIRRNASGDAIVPGILNHFETEDIVALIAPRTFVGLSGNSDHIFPATGVEDVVARAMPAFEALDAGNKVHAVEVEGAHRYYGSQSWDAWVRYIDPNTA